jgi:hypothetical protein
MRPDALRKLSPYRDARTPVMNTIPNVSISARDQVMVDMVPDGLQIDAFQPSS